MFSPPNRPPQPSEANLLESGQSSSNSTHQELKEQKAITITEERDDKEENEATITDEGMANDPPPVVMGVAKCCCLVEFICCYGPVLDSVRMKQLLCFREWKERKSCFTALTQAKAAVPGQCYMYSTYVHE